MNRTQRRAVEKINRKIRNNPDKFVCTDIPIKGKPRHLSRSSCPAPAPSTHKVYEDQVWREGEKP